MSDSPEKDPYLGYFTALGRFVHTFAQTETFAQLALWRLSNVDSKTARAVFSGVRIDQASSYVKRLGEVHDMAPERRAEFEYVLGQLSIINAARNSLLHHGASFSAKERAFISSNEWIALTPARVKEVAVTPDTLEDMTKDLRIIICYLTCWLTVPDTQVRKIFAESLVQPWSYKSP